MRLRFIIYLILIFLGIILGLRNWRRLNLSQKYIWAILVFVFGIELTGRLLAIKMGSSFPVYHLYLPISLLLLIKVYLLHFAKGKSEIILKSIGTIIFFACMWLSHFYSKWINFPSMQFVLISACIVMLSLFSIKQLLQSPSLVPLYKQVKFMFGMANIFFYSINFFIFSLFDPFKKHHFLIPEWEFTILYLSNIILYLIYLYCLSLDEAQLERQYGVYKF